MRPERKKGGGKTMSNTTYTVFELESAPRFPNLLNDKDFIYYCWTLPFCMD